MLGAVGMTSKILTMGVEDKVKIKLLSRMSFLQRSEGFLT